MKAWTMGLQTLVGGQRRVMKMKGVGTSCGQVCPVGCRPEHPVLSSAFSPKSVHEAWLAPDQLGPGKAKTGTRGGGF